MKYNNLPEKRILAFGDSNTYGYDPETDGRYGEQERWPKVLQMLLGTAYSVIEEGLPGRTTVFDDPISEGMCGLSYLTPCLMSHAPVDTLIIMLGTNDTKERFGCTPHLLGRGMARLLGKALATPAWRGAPDIIVVAPCPILPAYRQLMFAQAMGTGCSARAAGLAEVYAQAAREKGARFLDAGALAGVCVHPLDGMHLTRASHSALAQALVPLLKIK